MAKGFHKEFPQKLTPLSDGKTSAVFFHIPEVFTIYFQAPNKFGIKVEIEQ